MKEVEVICELPSRNHGPVFCWTKWARLRFTRRIVGRASNIWLKQTTVFHWHAKWTKVGWQRRNGIMLVCIHPLSWLFKSENQDVGVQYITATSFPSHCLHDQGQLAHRSVFLFFCTKFTKINTDSRAFHASWGYWVGAFQWLLTALKIECAITGITTSTPNPHSQETHLGAEVLRE